MTTTSAGPASHQGSALSPYTVAARLWGAIHGVGERRAAWLETRRPNQTPPPPGTWFVWLIMAGRGFGKTRTGAEEVIHQAVTVPNSEILVMGRTDAETRRVCFLGKSGIRGSVDPADLDGGMWAKAYTDTPGNAHLRFKNGSIIRAASSAGFEAVRGLNLHMAWVDELGSHRNQEEVWDDVLLPAVRMGDDPRIIVTTTPRPTRLIRRLFAEAETVVTRGSTWDNEANLSERFIAQMKRRYAGTRSGRQELEGELLGDVEGAVWNRAWIEDHRVPAVPEAARIAGRFRRVVVAGDPSDGTTSGDECGVAAVALGYDHRLYVIESDGMRVGTVAFIRYLLELTKEQGARLVVEKNHGGDYLVQTIRQVMRDHDLTVPFTMVTASVGKRTRAEPVASLYEQGRVSHVGTFADLEDQMCTWTAGPKEKSPDRMDALVWAASTFLEETFTLTEAERTGRSTAQTDVSPVTVFGTQQERPQPSHRTDAAAMARLTEAGDVA